MPVIPYVIELILWLLAAFSVVTWTILLIKMIVFTRLRRANARFLAAFNELVGAAALPALLRDTRGTFSLLAQAMLEELRVYAGNPVLTAHSRSEMLRHTLNQERRMIQTRLETGLAALASIGSISPILGLLGTVWSIMNLLRSISGDGSTGLDVVAGPIGDALITTAVGIIVAVPALLGHNFFARRVRVALMDMERFCERLQHLAICNGYGMDADGPR